MSTQETGRQISRRKFLAGAAELGLAVTGTALAGQVGGLVFDLAVTPGEERLREELLPSLHLIPKDTKPTWFARDDIVSIPWTERGLDAVWDGVKHIPHSFFDRWFSIQPVEIFVAGGAPLKGVGAFALGAAHYDGHQGIGISTDSLLGLGYMQNHINGTLMHETAHLVTGQTAETEYQWRQFVLGSLAVQERKHSEEIYYVLAPEFRAHETDNWRECIAAAAEWYTKGRILFDHKYADLLSKVQRDTLYSSLRDWMFLGHEFTLAGTIFSYMTGL